MQLQRTHPLIKWKHLAPLYRPSATEALDTSKQVTFLVFLPVADMLTLVMAFLPCEPSVI